jgi:hypothetical protein
MSICTLTECIHNNDDYDLNEALEPNQILEILSSIASHNYTQDDFYGKDDDEMEELNVSMKRLILAYVQKNCECIL